MKSLNHPNKQLSVDDEAFEKDRVIQTYIGSVCSLNAPDSDLKIPFHQRNSFLKITYGILKEMSDFSLLKENFGFLLITISNFFLFTGYFTPFLYISDVAIEQGIEEEKAAFLLSIIGIINIPARMLYGIIADRQFVSAINLNTFAVALATVPLVFYYLLKRTYLTQVLFVSVWAVGIGK